MTSDLKSCVYELLFLGFAFSLFLTLGSDRSDLLGWRMVFGAGLLIPAFIRPKIKSFSLFFFSLLFLYEILRAGWAFFVLRSGNPSPETESILRVFIQSPMLWFFYWGFFAAAYFFFSKKSRVWHLMNTFAWAGFFLAMNAIPPLFQSRENLGYAMGDRWTFFHPAFYVHPWIEKYIVGIFAHLNYVGDVIAFGFFAAAGMAFYTFQMLRNPSGQKNETSSGGWPKLFLILTQAFVCAAAILLILSRGSIAFLGMALCIFLAGIMLKSPGKGQRGFAVLLFAGMIGFLIWAGNLNEVSKELGTLQEESKKERSSLAHNQEGAARALRIYEAHRLFGVGTRGYSRVAEKYASPNTEKLSLANYEAMNHYLQVMAEEGAGAFLYFLFLLSYFLEMLWGLIKTQSRFKFISGLAFFSAVLMVLGHASINHLMERFPIVLLVSICMGAGLAVFRQDFQHE